MRRKSSRAVGPGRGKKNIWATEQQADDGYKLKEQYCHLPGFLGITILVAGSACQPWLTTPLDKEGGKGEENTFISKCLSGYVMEMNCATSCGNMFLYKADITLSFNLTFYCLFHRVSHKGSEIICCDGSVCLGH